MQHTLSILCNILRKRRLVFEIFSDLYLKYFMFHRQVCMPIGFLKAVCIYCFPPLKNLSVA